MVKSSVRLSISREKLIDICFLLAVSAAFLGFSLHQIDLPGLYGDELDKLVPTVSLLTGRPFLWVGGSKTFFGFRVLLAFTDRIGPVLSYLPMPFILLFGYTALAVRLTSVICACLTLIFAYYGAKIWCGTSAARFGIVLTAVNPAFVFLQRMGYYNYGPVTLFTSISFFFLARYISNRGVRNLWYSAAFAGIAVETALQAVFVLIPMALLATLFLVGGKRRVREIMAAFAIFIVISLPILWVGIKSGAMFQRIGWGGNSDGGLTVSRFLDNISAETLNFTGLLGDMDSIQVESMGKDFRAVGSPWMKDAFYLSILVLLLFFLFTKGKKNFIRHDAATMLITLCGLLLSGFNLSTRATYQLIVLWPFAMLAIGSALALLYRGLRPVRFLAVSVACLLVISQGIALVRAHQYLSQSRGRVYTSSRIYSLAKYLEERPELHVVTMGWGLINQIYYLTGGKVLPEALHGWWPKDGTPPEKFIEAVSRKFHDPKAVFIFFAPGEGQFDRYPHVETIAKNNRVALHLDKVFYERDGSIAYRLYRVGAVAKLSWQSSKEK